MNRCTKSCDLSSAILEDCCADCQFNCNCPVEDKICRVYGSNELCTDDDKRTITLDYKYMRICKVG